MADSSDRGPLDGGSPLFPAGFGHFDRPAPPPPDPTAESFSSAPITDAEGAVGASEAGDAPPPPPIPPGLPGANAGSPEISVVGRNTAPRWQPRTSRTRIPRWGWIWGLAMAGVIAVPSIAGLWGASHSFRDSDSGSGGFDFGESTEPLTADELYSESSYTFEIKLSDRTMEGELTRIEAFDHPDCDSAAVADELLPHLSECQHRIEAAYTGAYEGVRVSQQVLMFDGEESAEAFASELEGEFAGYALSFEHHPDFNEDLDEDL